MSEPVAVPVQQQEPVAEEPIIKQPEMQIVDENVDLVVYHKTHGIPFVADFFGLHDLYNNDKEIKASVDEVTEYIQNKTKKTGVVFLAKEMLNELSQEMNLKDNDAGIYKMKKVKQLIKMKGRLASLDHLRRKVLEDIDKIR